MLWALLIALLIAKLSGGPEEIFMIDKLDKEIKANIIDKERQKEIITVVKTAKKEIKTFRKLRKNKLKEIKKLGSSREVATKELMKVYDEYYAERLRMQSSLIEHRLKLQDLITEEEWEQLISNAVLPSEKAARKIEKSDNKEDKKVEKLTEEIESAITKEIGDKKRRDLLLESLAKFSETLEEFIEEGQRMNFKDNELVRNRSTTRQDLEDFYRRHNDLRYKGTEEYFALREAALSNTNEKEWKAIIKAMNTIVKS